MFSLDLSTTPSEDPGDWALGLLEPWTNQVIGGPTARPLDALEPMELGLLWPQIGTVGITIYDQAMALLGVLALGSQAMAEQLATSLLGQQSGSGANADGSISCPATCRSTEPALIRWRSTL